MMNQAENMVLYSIEQYLINIKTLFDLTTFNDRYSELIVKRADQLQNSNDNSIQGKPQESLK
jgi:uncharacterized protein YutD